MKDKENVKGLQCSTEWHLRQNPRAAVLYALAMHLTDGGERPFYLSTYQVGEYFNWSRHSTIEAFHHCIEQGAFILLSKGHGGKKGTENFSNTYQVITHRKLAETRSCRIPGAENALVQDLHHPGAENALPLVQDLHHPSAENAPGPGAGFGEVVSDFDSPKNSPKQISDPSFQSADAQIQKADGRTEGLSVCDSSLNQSQKQRWVEFKKNYLMDAIDNSDDEDKVTCLKFDMPNSPNSEQLSALTNQLDLVVGYECEYAKLIVAWAEGRAMPIKGREHDRWKCWLEESEEAFGGLLSDLKIYRQVDAKYGKKKS